MGGGLRPVACQVQGAHHLHARPCQVCRRLLLVLLLLDANSYAVGVQPHGG
jgi:hypothetical protein